MKNVTIIAAISSNGIIGASDKIPWHISEDLQRFKQLTINHPVIMGRKTFESLPKKPLSNRTNIICSRNKNIKFENVSTFSNIVNAIEYSHVLDNNVFVIGGSQIYNEAIHYATKLEITWIHENFAGDVFFFPFTSKAHWSSTNTIQRTFINKLTNKPIDVTFETFTKIT